MLAPRRACEWLELLVDAGGEAAAKTVAAIDTNLVVAGLARHVRVFNPATFAPAVSSDDEPFDLAVTRSGDLACEVGGYLVRAKRSDEAWDAIVMLLTALDADHHDYFHAVMRGCRRLSHSTPEIDGLDDLLMAPEQLLHEVAVEREHRRSQQGYLSPADARAFLRWRSSRDIGPHASAGFNPLVAAYFRAADEETASAGSSVTPPGSALDASASASISDSIDAVVDLLAEAGLVPGRPPTLIEGTAPEPSPLTHVRRLMEHVRDIDDAAHLARSRELAFLANTLMAGCSVQERPFTAQEASDAAIGICNLGLEHWPEALPDPFLVDHDLVTAFELGWAVLHQDVSLFVTDHLIGTLTNLGSVDAELQRELYVLRRELMRQRDAGTPWRARHALEVIAMLDGPAWASLRGLLDECPVLPAALRATVGGHTGAVSATAFEFISTTSHIGEIRAFVGKLPEVLLR